MNYPKMPIQEVADRLMNARQAKTQVEATDPRIVQLIALFKMSDERGKETLLAIAGIHAARFPWSPK